MPSSRMQGRYVDESACSEETAAIGYPPCEQGIVFRFLPEPGHTYRAIARSSTGNPQPADRLVIQRSEFDQAFIPFSAEVANPSIDNFHRRVEIQVDVPLGGSAFVVVSVTRDANVTNIVVKPATLSPNFIS